ncbi:MAG: N-acetylmuramoyl-L-alanine amidase [Oscillochloridaceae bacterium umkhey_bin13]
MSRFIVGLIWLVLLAGCSSVAATSAQLPTPAAIAPLPSVVTATVLPTRTMLPPTATIPPRATPLPATATPLPATATPDPNAPPRVGLQVGHWRIEEHPDEQARLRRFSGAYYRGYDEWEVNILIAEQVRDLLQAAGVTVELLPATVPMGYEADVFVSIHVDGVVGEQAATRRGWKLATPFRASLASEQLVAALSGSYPAATGLPADPLGPSYDMRAYYAFASYRYWHSIASTTPAVIIECGFMTHPADRELIFNGRDRIAAGIARGILAYLAEHHPATSDARVDRGPATLLRPLNDATPLYARADAASRVILDLNADQRLVALAQAGDWRLVFTHGGDWDLGWVRRDALIATNEPLAPPHARP